MKKKSSEDVTNWVVGKEFSKEKLMNPLAEIDSLFKIAEFGYSDYEESLQINSLAPEKINYRKVVAFKLLVSNLILIIDNSKFAVVNKLNEMTAYLKKLEIINSMIDDNNLFVITSREEAKLKKSYKPVLNIVRKIKARINTPLYKNNLIYITKENYDPKEAKESVLAEAYGDT